MSVVRVSFDVEGPWKYLTLAVGDLSVRVGGFDDGSDWLGDTVRAALAMATRAFRADVIYDGEPTAWRLRAKRDWNLPPDSEILQLTVERYQDTLSARSEAGELLFEARCEVDAFAAAVVEAADQILRVHGEDGYQALTRLEAFPRRALAALRTALRTEAPRQPRRSTEGPNTVFIISGPGR